MGNVPPPSPTKRYEMSRSQVFLLAAFCAILLITVSWTVMWTSTNDIPMSKESWIALGLGTVFSLPIGCGLMVLMFYSSRNGHDEAATPKFRKDDT